MSAKTPLLNQGGSSYGGYSADPGGHGSNNPYPSGYSAPHVVPVEAPTFNGATPDQDMDENNKLTAPSPSAPPASMFQSPQGYDFVDPGKGVPLQPPTATAPPPEPSQRSRIPPVPTLSAEQARSALLDEVSQHCCWGKSPAKNMFFTDIRATHAFHYKLETFTEKRSIHWNFESYNGQPIDSAHNGQAPGPWDIPARPRALFKNQTLKVVVPHTSSVANCHHCNGHRQIRCHKCCGRGRVRCARCRGVGFNQVSRDGHKVRESCNQCFGTGRKRCNTCVGHGQISCPVCLSTGQLITFLELTINWINHSSDHTVVKTSLPQKLVQGAPGHELFREEGYLVPPVSQFDEDSVNTGSHGLVSRHSTQWPMERILQQRHIIRSVPVYEAHYSHKDRLRCYYVYGLDHKVHCPDYPAKVCMGCVIA